VFETTIQGGNGLDFGETLKEKVYSLLLSLKTRHSSDFYYKRGVVILDSSFMEEISIKPYVSSLKSKELFPVVAKNLEFFMYAVSELKPPIVIVDPRVGLPNPMGKYPHHEFLNELRKMIRPLSRDSSRFFYEGIIIGICPSDKDSLEQRKDFYERKGWNYFTDKLNKGLVDLLFDPKDLNPRKFIENLERYRLGDDFFKVFGNK
jgi:hypothetical protein